jgi:HTH-type transcriptional regulator/antitoxin HigA
MEQSDLKPKDLTPMIGNLNRVYEILGYKCVLTLPMIRRLHRDLHIPAQSLTSETVVKAKSRFSKLEKIH